MMTTHGNESTQRSEHRRKTRTMMSRSVSRFTLKGIFLITMAVGITSSSRPPWLGVFGPMGGACRCAMGGEPPIDEKSELLWGDRGRLSGTAPVLSIHCCTDGDAQKNQHSHRRRSGKYAHSRKTAAERLVLER